MTSQTARLHVVMRSYGGENMKDRPAYYSKLTCLASVVRAAQALTPAAELIFVNDGPIPDDREAMMRSAGEVVRLAAGSNRASYRAAVQLAVRRKWADNDLVWFAEDDYLYTPRSFEHLMAAAQAPALAAVEYFSMYGGSAFDTSSGRLHAKERPQRGAAGEPSPTVVGDLTWYRSLATTSSFGVRRSALVVDAPLLRLMPFTGGAWDRTSCLTIQGLRPFTRQELAEDLLPFRAEPVSRWPRAWTRGLVRLTLSPRALRRASRRRTMLGSDPDQAGHLELEHLSPGTDWELLSAQTRAWAERWTATVPTGADHS